MAFYEMLPGAGMPPGLQAGMDSVLNKKFGTSTTYPAEDWPDTVNLMGMLEEKTVSGTIAHFDDGADAVPLKSLNAGIAPNLEGVDKVKVTHAGRNLFNESFELGSVSESKPVGSTYSQIRTTSTTRGDSVNLIPLPKSGTYKFSCASGYSLFMCYFDENQLYLGLYSGWSTNHNPIVMTATKYVSVTFKRTDEGAITQSDFDAVNVQIEVGSTAHDYEAYTAPTEYEVDIPNPNPNLRLTADVDDGQWNTDGTIHTSSGGSWYRAFTMAVSEKTTYDIYGLLDDLIVYLDSNKTMISYERLSNTALSLQDERKTTPANCAYIGLTALVFDVSSVSVKESFLVYGGSWDVLGGTIESTHNIVDLGSLTWTYHSATASYEAFFDSYLPNDSITGDSTVAFDGYTDDYKSIPSSLIALPNQPQYDDMVMALAKNTRRIIICDIRYSTAEAFTEALDGVMLSYPIASPESLSVSSLAIDSKANSNNIWNDAGDTEVTYRSMGTVYQYPEGEEVYF